MDVQVLATQRWLNTTYGSVSGWVPLAEDGATGWQTIYGLRRGLQTELGISPVSSGFGPATTAAFKSKIGRIDASSNLSLNLWMLLSGALWCKGYAGLFAGGSVGFSPMSASITWIRSDLGLVADPPFVDVKLMASLLSMDAYKLISGGTTRVRSVQQWLNTTYLSRADFAVIPCDGVYSRQVQTALLYALQYEIGLADGVANGSFGNQTKAGLKAQGTVSLGSSDGSHRFVHLFQAACRFNGLSVPFDGSFDSSTKSAVEGFQSFMEIPVNGRGDYTTWCNLLVSCGDVTLPTKGLDTATPLKGGRAAGAKASGYTHVGRYLVGTTKYIDAGELDELRAAGLRLFPIEQRSNNSAGAMTYSDGWAQAVEAVKRARVLGLPANSTIFFAVDFDPEGDIITGPVLDFFQGVNDAVDLARSYTFKIGVYGTRNVCSQMIEANKAVAAFVAGMSSGYSGNMGFPMPAEWHYNQVIGASESFGGGSNTAIDHDKVSSRAASVDLSGVITPPVEHDGSATATGFDVAFEWVVGAEVACEQAIRQANGPLTPTAPYVSSIPDFVLDWMRKPTYWGTSESALWPKFTPVVDTNNNEALARRATVEALSLVSPSKPQSSRDTAHWAATLLGYRMWGVPTDPAAYGLGDLGGWLLDLLQAFGVWYRTSQGSALSAWMAANIGILDASKFGFADLVADADAWLVAKAMNGASGQALSDAMRTVYKLTPSQRLAKFYTDRFARSSDNVATHFQRLADGIDAGGVNLPVTTGLLLMAADAPVLPTQEQAANCGHALAAFLAQQS